MSDNFGKFVFDGFERMEHMQEQGNFQDNVTVFVEVIGETVNAIKCLVDGKEVWIPRSQIIDSFDIRGLYDKGDLTIPEWLAVEKEIV